MKKLLLLSLSATTALTCRASDLSIAAVPHLDRYVVTLSADAPVGYLLLDWARWAGDANYNGSLTADETINTAPAYIDYTATFVNPSGVAVVSEGSSVVNFSWIDGTPDTAIADSNGALFTNGYRD